MFILIVVKKSTNRQGLRYVKIGNGVPELEEAKSIILK